MTDLVENRATVEIQLVQSFMVIGNPIEGVILMKDVMAKGQRAQSLEMDRAEIKFWKPAKWHVGVKDQRTESFAG